MDAGDGVGLRMSHMGSKTGERDPNETHPVTAAPSRATLRRIRDVLARVPSFGDTRWDEVEITPFNSFTNMSYKLTAHGSAYVVRLAGKGTSAYIARGAEEHNARIATEAGLNAEVLFFDAKDGTMLSRFIEGLHMDKMEFRRDPDAPARAALTLKQLHGIARTFRSRFGPFAPIDYYLDLLRALRSPPPDAYFEAKRDAERVLRVLESAPVPLAPCHNDTCPENFVEVSPRVYLIDWEYSGMNDPAWDLAALSVEAGFGPEQDEKMVNAYCGGTASGAAPAGFYGRVVLQKAMSDYFWGLWSVVQHVNGNPAAEFQAYATDRFDRCNRLMGSDEFSSCLEAVRSGSRPN
jgi:thiamine kinase-like enzyme